MNLHSNPIIVTQRRLVHRGGVLAPVLITVLIGLSLLAALIYNLALSKGRAFETPTKTGVVFYGGLLGIQALILILGGFSRISRTLVAERQNGLFDSNRLTPLTPGQLVLGYWLGPALREGYMAVALAPVGLAMVLAAKLSLGLWVGTQALLFTSALFFGLLAVLAGLAMPRAQGGAAAVALFPILVLPTLAGGRFALTGFLLPAYATVQLFPLTELQATEWTAAPQIFGWSISSLVLTFALQLVVGVSLWRAAIRKVVNPSQPSLSQSQALVVFAILVILQHGLVWDNWHGAFPGDSDLSPMLSLVHAAVLLLGLNILIATSLLPERARLAAIRGGADGSTRTFRRSGTATACALAGVASVALLTQFARSLNEAGPNYLLAVANLFLVFLMFSMSLELCRVRLRGRAMGFFALALFVLWALPFLLSLTFASEIPLRFSFLTPGVVALADPGSPDLELFYFPTLVQAGVVVILLMLWSRCWRSWLQRVAPAIPAVPDSSPPQASGPARLS